MFELLTPSGLIVRVPLVPLAALSLLGSLAGGVLTLCGLGRGLVREWVRRVMG